MKRFAFALAAVPLLLAAGAVPTGAAANDTRVRLVYLSPDDALGQVDFYVDGKKALGNTVYDTYSPYQSVAPGQHTFEVRKAGEAASSSASASVQQSLDAGYYSVFVGGKVGSPTCPVKAVIFTDQVTTPPAGQVTARFVHMAPEVPGVDVATDDSASTILFKNVSCFQGSSYASLPAGNYPVKLLQTGTDNRLFGTKALMPNPGVVWTLVGAGGVGHPVVLAQIPDAASSGAAPVGAAATGEGGTAFGGLVPLGLIVSSMVACALLLLFARRSPV